MADIPYNEPAQLRAWDSTSWLKTVDDYPPADGWTLKYAFRNAASKFPVTATTSGTDYLATITRAVSKTWTPGRYDWVCYVTKGAAPNDEQHTVDEGSVDVLPDLSADVTYDARSEARQIYDSLLAKYKAFISSGGEMQSMSIAGKSVAFRTAEDFLTQLRFWAGIVAEEEKNEKVKNGADSKRLIRFRFGKA